MTNAIQRHSLLMKPVQYKQTIKHPNTLTYNLMKVNFNTISEKRIPSAVSRNLLELSKNTLKDTANCN